MYFLTQEQKSLCSKLYVLLYVKIIYYLYVSVSTIGQPMSYYRTTPVLSSDSPSAVVGQVGSLLSD